MPTVYSVSRARNRIRGRPYPIEKRSTLTSSSLAAAKWPSSWIRTSRPARPKKYRTDMVGPLLAGPNTSGTLVEGGFEDVLQRGREGRGDPGPAGRARQARRSPARDVRAV